MFSINIPRHLRTDYALALVIPVPVIVLTAWHFRDGVASFGQIYGALVVNATAMVSSVIMIGFVRRRRHVIEFARVGSHTFLRFVSLLDDLGHAKCWRNCAAGVTYMTKRDKSRLALHVSEEIRGSGTSCVLEKTYVIHIDGSGPVLQFGMTKNIKPDGTYEEPSPEELKRLLASTPSAHMYVSTQELAELCEELEAARPAR